MTAFIQAKPTRWLNIDHVQAVSLNGMNDSLLGTEVWKVYAEGDGWTCEVARADNERDAAAKAQEFMDSCEKLAAAANITYQVTR